MQILKNVLSFTGLVVGVPVSLPHQLQAPAGVAQVPRLVALTGGGYTVTATTTHVTVTREAAGAAAVAAYVETWHSLETCLPPSFDTNLFPFVVNPAGGGGGGAVVADGVTITGDGTAGDPLTAISLASTGLFNVIEYGADPTGVADSQVSINATITAAAAYVTSTGFYATVYFPAGVYSVRTRSTGFTSFSISNLTKLMFLGDAGDRSRLVMNGDAALNDWFMFQVRGGSTNIEFRQLWLDMTGITNPDPAEQAHLIQLGNTAPGISDIRVIDCTFNYSVGEGVRLLGEFGSVTDRVLVQNCRFLNCGRAGVSFQRWCTRVRVLDNYFINGTDQQIDFEPTGYTFNATGGTATTLIFATGQFVTWGIAAGDLIYNSTEDLFARVVSVDSPTQLTLTAGAVTWNGAAFSFPKSNSGHLIEGNQLIRGTNAGDILMTLTGTYQSRITNNWIEGSIQGVDVLSTEISSNTLITLRSDSGATAINLIKSCDDLDICHNKIFLQAITQSTLRGGINIGYQIRTSHFSRIIGNSIYSECRTTAIGLTGPRNVLIKDNQAWLNTPGETDESVGIFIQALAGFSTESVVIDGNHIQANEGTFKYGIWLSASGAGNSIGSAYVGGNRVTGCSSNPIRFSEDLSGAFTTPPVLGPGIVDTGTVFLPTAVPWLVLSGLGGAGPFTSSLKPCTFWGTGTPEGVLTAGVGALALRSDGGAGTCLYIKESGAGTTTGWVAK